MKKKTIAVAIFVLCIFVFAAIGNLGCLARSEVSNSQSSGFRTISMLDNFIGNDMSIIPSGPGSGGGRGPLVTM
jgi:hypothetical protein